MEETKKKRFLSRKRLIILTPLLILIVAAGSTYLYLNGTPPSPIPKTVSQSVAFQLYYPSKLPEGYTFDKSSFNSSNQVVIYALLQQGKKKVFVTNQPEPAGFNFDDFNKKQLSGSKTVLTPYGEAVVGIFGDKIVGSIVIDKTWILINTAEENGAAPVEQILKSLTLNKS